MAPDMWFFSAIVGLLTAALSGHPSPAPSEQSSTSHAESQRLEPGQRLGVRLVNGSSHCSGTVEVWLELSWEPVCGALWDSLASEAVCLALGCGGAWETTQPTLPFLEKLPGPGVGNSSAAPNSTLALAPAILCRSPEWKLCKVVEHACNSSRMPAKVTCAENRAVRLVGGSSRCAGRVEMLEQGQWGSVCDDTWDLEDSHVVCRQLNCGWAIQAVPGLHFAPGQGPIHRDQVNCSGEETYLWDCPGLPGDGYCGHKEDAGVVCSEHQSWRLTGGRDPCEGQVEVHFRGVWSTVCNSEWYSQEAHVLCQALGCGTMVRIPSGRPHSLPGRMYYSCTGKESILSDCSWRFNNSNLCSQSSAAQVLCSGSRSLLNLSTPEVPTSVEPVTVESSVTVKTEDWKSRELMLLILCIILGILLLGLLIFTAFIFLKVKGKYALPVMVNDQRLLNTTPDGINSYQDVPITIPKEEVLQLPIQVQAPLPKDSDSSSDSDYEHYDFSAQPPMALTTFYNSQRHRVTEEEAQQNRFRMPPLEEGLEEMRPSEIPPVSAGHYTADAPSMGSQHRPRSNSGSSTSSGEDYCNSPSSRLPPWTPQVFSAERSPLVEQPPSLELAGSRGTFSAGPSADDSSSTSSGEWYQNFQPPPQPPSTEQFECPGSPTTRPESLDSEDYDDIGAA
ncbi:T-cell differentiation antigen CD6 isoform X1 [Enhydra lutris kenyoni]|uniref:T-cell differentiation antigen CD6 n=1 Tax=Enhydra lutris kenyoni TaxID=391180 RepID=A0A2Y9JY73_ENHLU|nr:T-cell differentiation antigen CD6 isoform X1 [Enhydra lutris kenyoni]